MQSQGISAFSIVPTEASAPFPIGELVKQQVPAGRFTRLAHLLAAEEVLDILAANSIWDSEYLDIENRAKSYIAEHPELLNSPWLRNDGAVYDLIAEARETRLSLQESDAALTRRAA